MKDLDQSFNPKLLTFAEAAEAQDIYVNAEDSLLRKVFSPHIATGLDYVEDEGYRVALLIEKQKHEKSARKLAKKCIADIPISIRVIGKVEKVD